VKLTDHRYGKGRVRVLKILRDGDVHTVKELTARVLLEGDFARSFTDADNASVVATDTIKNTVLVLAHDELGQDIEPFALAIARHFLGRYPHVSSVDVDLEERLWTRMPVDGVPHPHSFARTEVARPYTRVLARRDGVRHESGVRDLTILKSTGSGFEKFHRDDLTTLPETRDRVLATAARASWRWLREPKRYADTNRAIVHALLVPFATRYSPSVQATLFEMGTAALEACPEIDDVTLVMPNLHYLPLDLSAFGRTNRQVVLLPTDEPHGHIEATISR